MNEWKQNQFFETKLNQIFFLQNCTGQRVIFTPNPDGTYSVIKYSLKSLFMLITSVISFFFLVYSGHICHLVLPQHKIRMELLQPSIQEKEKLLLIARLVGFI